MRVVKQGAAAAQAAAPAWFTAMADKTWATPVGNTLNDVKSSHDPDKFAAICTAWTGGCVNQVEGEFILAANGGHGDYSGNEAYGCRLITASPVWARINDPSTATGGDTTGRDSANNNNTAQNYGDGAMTSVHGWHRPVFGNGYMWHTGIDGGFSAGNWSTACYRRSRSTHAWESLGVAVSTASPGNLIGQAGVGVWDSTNNRVWSCVGAGANGAGIGLYSLDGTTGSITAYAVEAGSGLPRWGAACPDLGIVIFGCPNTGTLRVLQTASPGSGYTSRTPTGTFPPDGNGCVYHAASRALFFWHGNGADIIKMSIPADPLTGTYIVSTVSPSGSNAITPTGAQPNGTYSRFNIIADMGNGQSALCLVNSVTGSTYIYKLPAAGV